MTDRRTFSGTDLQLGYLRFKGRTNFALSNIYSAPFRFSELFRDCPNIEVAKMGAPTYTNVSSLYACFYGCKKLETILGEIKVTSSIEFGKYDFGHCKALKNMTIKGVCKNIYFNYSPNLSKESLIYLLTNRANATTATITVTLHSTAYARLSADADVTALLSATGTQGAVTLASA